MCLRGESRGERVKETRKVEKERKRTRKKESGRERDEHRVWSGIVRRKSLCVPRCFPFRIAVYKYKLLRCVFVSLCSEQDRSRDALPTTREFSARIASNGWCPFKWGSCFFSLSVSSSSPSVPPSPLVFCAFHVACAGFLFLSLSSGFNPAPCCLLLSCSLLLCRPADVRRAEARLDSGRLVVVVPPLEDLSEYKPSEDAELFPLRIPVDGMRRRRLSPQLTLGLRCGRKVRFSRFFEN
ncbi:hypothetical protein TGRUB_267790B [Toxoplasma gondii RUB]|uniref:Uncharacterized protein n=1 Tax=Toxoplasma gondii RUB TaxID=935652 RepID=A0A086LQP9_TOXGO|nr:hypothetical protein TGRUB_267790B [Toxoplasma gondii RUB]